VLSVTAPGFTGSGAVNTGFINVRLKEPNERTRSQEEIVQAVNRNFGKFTFGKAFAIQEQTISVQRGGSAYPVVFVLQNINFDKLTKVMPVFLDEVTKNPVFQGADVDLKFNKPELTISIDRAKASQLGVSVADVSQTLQLALSNGRLGYFTMNGKQYQVLGQVSRVNREAPVDLKTIFVKNNTGEFITLDNVITMAETTSPSQIYHYNRYKSATISAGLAPGKTIGDGIDEMNRIYESLKQRKLADESFSTSLGGASKDYVESSSNTLFAFILALVLIYLILAAQFESFMDPLIIMLTVPLAIAGAVLSLYFFGHTLNIFSQIGMIMLIGLVTKNGILIVEYANHIRDQGKSKMEAAVTAATMRLRPILMTSLAMIFGALPLALSLGAASTSRIPLGVVIVYGVLFSLVLSLFILPVMYTFLSRRKVKTATALDKISE
jgi:multidrug efflux pump